METGLFVNFTINEKLPSHRTEIVVVVVVVKKVVIVTFFLDSIFNEMFVYMLMA